MKQQRNPQAKAASPAKQQAKAATFTLPLEDLQKPWYNKNLQILLLVVLATALYTITCWGKYALDDLIVITGNKFTLQGFKGLYNIIFKDSFLGYTGMENQLSGGRYRPLSIATFAIELELLGEKHKAWHPHIAHSINVVLYGIATWLMYKFFDKWIFKGRPMAAFIATLIFVIHPIHTEVVANIKSRDELMCLIFLVMSMDFALKYFIDKKSITWLWVGMLMYLLSLLSKENGVVFFVIVPMIVYTFHNRSLSESLKTGLPFFIFLVLYLGIRAKITSLKVVQNSEVLNAPYLYANAIQAAATKIMVLGKFLIMLIIPYPMSYDYSYNEIRYTNFSDFRVILSFIVNAGLFIFALRAFFKRNVYAFCILFYFACLSLVCNFVFDVGTIFADRFLFQPTIALSIAAAHWMCNYIYDPKKESSYKTRLATVSLASLVWIVPYTAYSWERNNDWLNEYTLFTKDVISKPNSAKTHSNCGVVLINYSGLPENEKRKTEILNDAVKHLNKATSIHPGFVDAWVNTGIAYSRLEDINNMEKAWVEAHRLSPNHPKVIEVYGQMGDFFAFVGYKKNQEKKYAESAALYEKAIFYNCHNAAESWYNMGGNYLMINNVNRARECWMNTVRLNPKHQLANEWLARIGGAK